MEGAAPPIYYLSRYNSRDFFSSFKMNQLLCLKKRVRRDRQDPAEHDRSRLALQLEPLIAGKAKERQYKGTNQYSLCQKSDEPPIDTKKELATLAGVSHDTIAAPHNTKKR